MTGLLVARNTDEEAPLLGGGRKLTTLLSPSSSSPGSSITTRWRRVRRHLAAEVNREWADIVLILCYLITGLLDSSCFLVWGSFVSMQTGNSVYIGLGLSAPTQSTRWIKSSVSVASFCAGSFIFSRIHRFFVPKRRWVLCLSFLIQTAITASAASIVTWSTTTGLRINAAPTATTLTVLEDESVTWHVLLPISLLAFQSSAQAVASRVLRYNTLTTVALTGTYCDLFSDVDVFSPLLRNTERSRRLGAPLCLLVGAFLGGRFAHSPPFGVAGALWLASALKLGVVMAWLFWPAKEGTGMGMGGLDERL